MGLSSSPGIFRELCCSRAFGLREVTPGQQVDGAGEMGEPHSWRVPMLLCAALSPKTQPRCASVSPDEGGVSYEVTWLLETLFMQCWRGGRSVQTFHRFLWSRSTLRILWPWDAQSRAPELSCFLFLLTGFTCDILLLWSSRKNTLTAPSCFNQGDFFFFFHME